MTRSLHCPTTLQCNGGIELNSRVTRFFVTAWLVVLPAVTLAQSDSPDALLRLFKGNGLATEMLPGEPIKPPYIIEVWVDSAHGLRRENKTQKVHSLSVELSD